MRLVNGDGGETEIMDNSTYEAGKYGAMKIKRFVDIPQDDWLLA